MTVVGKILVFINLIFSVIVGALVVMVYMTRINYQATYADLKAKYEVLQASRDAYVHEAARTKLDSEGDVRKVQGDLKAAQGQAKNAEDKAEQLQAEVEKKNEIIAQRDAQIKQAQAEVERRQAEVTEVKANLDAETRARLEQVTVANKYREEAVSAQIEARTIKDQNNRLVGQLQDMAKDLEKVKSGPTGGTTTASKSGVNPPPDKIEGLIKSTSNSGLVTVSLGTDAGLALNHTLEVFRLSPVPSQSKYLGTIRIIEVRNTEAVGQPVKPLSDKPVVGDRVASRILGGS